MVPIALFRWTTKWSASRFFSSSYFSVSDQCRGTRPTDLVLANDASNCQQLGHVLRNLSTARHGKNGTRLGPCLHSCTIQIIKLSVFDKPRPLIKIRNPWGEKEWRGGASDRDNFWRTVSPNDKKRLGFGVNDDGIFFMFW